MPDPMKLGISSYTYTWNVGVPGFEPASPRREQELVGRARSLGVTLVQIADNLPLERFSKDRLNDLKALAETSGVSLEVGARGMTGERLETYLEIAAGLGSPLLRFVIDGPDFRPGTGEVVRIIRSALPELEKRKVILALENHDRFSSGEFREIMEETGSESVGICLDSVNSMGAGEGIESVTLHLAPYTVNLHIKDFQVRRLSHMMGFTVEGRPAGGGQLPIAWMLNQLTERCTSAILELWTPPEAAFRDTLEKEKRWAELSIAHLKKTVFQSNLK